ncbi:hypothetical protein HG530_005970 [Fusarium avenaceum]|nr:hypothetical protein HG530_005970 [Fusarium avenaceum]
MDMSTPESTQCIVWKTVRIRFGKMRVLEDDVIVRPEVKTSLAILDSTLEDETGHDLDLARQLHDNLLEACLGLVVIVRQVTFDIILSPGLLPDLMAVVGDSKDVLATFD